MISALSAINNRQLVFKSAPKKQVLHSRQLHSSTPSVNLGKERLGTQPATKFIQAAQGRMTGIPVGKFLVGRVFTPRGKPTGAFIRRLKKSGGWPTLGELAEELERSFPSSKQNVSLLLKTRYKEVSFPPTNTVEILCLLRDAKGQQPAPILYFITRTLPEGENREGWKFNVYPFNDIEESIGAISVYRRQEHRNWHIQLFQVNEKYRGKGIGSRLLQLALEHCVAPPKIDIQSTGNAMPRLLTTYGFKQVNDSRNYWIKEQPTHVKVLENGQLQVVSNKTGEALGNVTLVMEPRAAFIYSIVPRPNTNSSFTQKLIELVEQELQHRGYGLLGIRWKEDWRAKGSNEWGFQSVTFPDGQTVLMRMIHNSGVTEAMSGVETAEETITVENTIYGVKVQQEQPNAEGFTKMTIRLTQQDSTPAEIKTHCAPPIGRLEAKVNNKLRNKAEAEKLCLQAAVAWLQQAVQSFSGVPTSEYKELMLRMTRTKHQPRPWLVGPHPSQAKLLGTVQEEKESSYSFTLCSPSHHPKEDRFVRLKPAEEVLKET